MHLLEQIFGMRSSGDRRHATNAAKRRGQRRRPSAASSATRFEPLERRAMLSVNPGDIAFVMFNFDNPDAFAFVALADIAAGEQIKFTDNGWTSGGGFRSNEGTMTYTTPSGGLTAGQVVEPPVSSVAFAASGDQILAYQGSTSFVAAINSEGSGVWQSSATDSNTSALPSGLVNGTTAVAVNEVDNARYTGTLSGTREELLAAINNKDNWEGDNSNRYSWDRGSFIVAGSVSPLISAPASVASFSSVEGSASASASVAVVGSNLSEGIVATAPTGFEVSLDDTSFSSSVTLPQAGGDLYVRVADSAAAGGVSGTLTLSSANASDVSVALTGTVRAATLSLPYGPQDFEDEVSEPWFTHDAGGSNNWEFRSGSLTGTADQVWEMNGYNSIGTANDWLMIGGFDFTNVATPVVEFNTITRYTSGVDELFLKYSTNYSGVGDPSLATWTTVDFTRAASENTESPSGQVLLPGAAGSANVYIAFHYVAGGTTSGTTAIWQVDDFQVYEAQTFSLSIAGVPATLDEGEYDILGTVSIPEPRQTNTVVTITSSDATEIVVDNGDLNQGATATVTIFAGDTSAEFYIEALEDNEVDADIPVTLTASVADSSYDPATATVTVVNIDATPAMLPAGGYTQTFSTFSAATPDLPLGWSLEGETTTFPDSGNGWGEGTTGGLRGGANVLGYQPSGPADNLTATLTLQNDTGTTLTDITIAYTGRAERLDDPVATKVPAFEVTVDGSVVEALGYATSDGDNARRSASLSNLTILPGETFQVVWSADRGTGTGSSPQIGISEVSVTVGSVQTVPTVTQVSVPRTTTGRDSATAIATVSSDGGATLSATGFVYIASAGLTGELDLATPGAITVPQNFAGVGQITETISGLTSGTTYTLRAYATNAEGTTLSAPVSFTTQSAAPSFGGLYQQDFSSFQGTLPDGWWTTSTLDVDGYGGEWGTGSSGGLRGVGDTETDGVLGYQHTTTTGVLTVTLSLVNTTGSTITELDIGYLGRVARETQERTPEWAVSVEGTTVAGLAYSTGNTSGVGGEPADESISARVSGLSIADGEVFEISWSSFNESAAGGQSGNSRQIGIGDVSIQAPGVAVPSVSVDGSLSAFATVSGAASAAGSVGVSGSNLQGDVTATAAAGFEVSSDGVNFGPTAVFPATNGSASGTLSVRVAATAAVGEYADSIRLSSPSAANVDVAVTASVAMGLPYGRETFEAGFDDGIAEPYATFNAAGSDNWELVTSTRGVAEGLTNRTLQMNGFGSDVAADDWLILGSFDFTSAVSPAISFTTLNDFTAGGTVVDELSLKVSTDYSGTGDPSLATWTKLPFTKPAAEEVKTASVQVPLTGTAGESSVFVAFHYVAAGTGGDGGDTALWQVDDVVVAEAATPAVFVTAAPTITEESFDVEGTVSIPQALGVPLNVTLTSSDAGELLLDNGDFNLAATAVVTIPAGQTSAGFYITGELDGIVDDDVAVTISAAAAGYDSLSTVVTVVNVDVPGADLTTDGYTEDFSGFTSAETLPLGWSITADGSASNRLDYSAWGETSTGVKHSSGTTDVFGYQHTGSTGVVRQSLTLTNATGSAINAVTISYEGRVERPDEGRTPSFTVYVGETEATGLAYSTSDGDAVTKQASVGGLSIAAGEKFTISWESDGSTSGSPGSGSRQQIGLGNVSVTVGTSLLPPSVGGLEVPTATLGRTTATAAATVTADGGSTLTAAGFVYIATADLSGELTLATAGAVNVAAGSPAVGGLAETLTGLTAGTEYTLRAYATNAEGTSYTAATTFTTVSAAVSLVDSYTQDFSSFTGTLPGGWAAASSGGVDGYVGEWGSGTSGGFRGVGETTGGVLGYQHSSSSGTLTVSLTLVNDSGSVIESLDVGYLGRVERADQGRPPAWSVAVNGSEVSSLAYSTDNTAGVGGVAGDQQISATLSGLSIGTGQEITITWTSDRGESEAGGASRQIGIADVSVSVGGGVAPTPTVGVTAGSDSDDLRIVSYNIASGGGNGQPRSGLDTVLEAISNENYAGLADQIDLLALQEVDSQLTTTAAVVSSLNAIYGGGTYSRGTLNGSGSFTVGVVYNSQSLTLVEEVAITTGGPRQAIRYRFEPVNGSASDGFYLYNAHLKADPDSSSQVTRQAEAAAIRSDADALPVGSSIIYAGDFNLYTSNEGAYQAFVAAGNGQAFDPISSPGNWSGSSSFRGIFTQAPLQNAAPDLVGGGLDDRFDFQLISAAVQDGSGFEYQVGSYRAFGNNGSVPVNGDINSSGNTALAGLANRTQVLDLLTTVSDHLPVVADYSVPTAGGLDALTTEFGTASAAGSFSVSGSDLGGDLTVAAPSGFEVSLAESSGYASQITVSPVGGSVATTTIYIRLAADTAVGSYSGDVTVSAAGASSQTLAVPESTVTAPAVVSIDIPAGTTLTLAEAGFGSLTGSQELRKTGTGTLLLDTANSFTGATTITGGAIIVSNAGALASSSVTVSAGGRLEISGTTNAALGGLNVDGGLVDLGTGSVTVASGGVSEADLRTWIKDGRNGGAWNGTDGITSDEVAAAAGTRAIGYKVNGDGSILAGYSAPGDSDMNGSVALADLGAMLAAGRFNTGGGANWQAGDFDYDGEFKLGDLGAMLSAGVFNQGSYMPQGSQLVALFTRDEAALIESASAMTVEAPADYVNVAATELTPPAAVNPQSAAAVSQPAPEPTTNSDSLDPAMLEAWAWYAEIDSTATGGSVDGTKKKTGFFG